MKIGTGSIDEEKSIQIAFSNFMIVHKTEFLSCDSTCVIGELGGNMGFFLGGSILAIVDFIISCLSKVIEMIFRKFQTHEPQIKNN